MKSREEGSIVIFMSILMILTSLVTVMLVEVQFGLKSTRRAGDSANALQVADAGINDATQAVATAATTSFTRTGTVGSGTFTYTATRDAVNFGLWHVDSVGVDATGVRRRVLADASGVSQFSSPMFVRNIYSNGAGANIDSYYSGLNNTTGCTRKGIISVTDGKNMKITGSGGGNANCTGKVIDPSWGHGIDGCFVYDKTGSASNPPVGPARCPHPNTGYTKIIDQEFPAAPVSVPVYDGKYFKGGPTGTPVDPVTSSTFVCDSSTVNGRSLESGTGVYYDNVVLLNGCGLKGTVQIDPADGRIMPAKIYAKSITVGATTGANAMINAPTAAQCSALGVSTAGWTYQDIASNPSHYYCSGWSQTLQIFVPNTLAGSPLTGGSIVLQQNGTKIWSLINAPDATVTLQSPQLEMWGAMVAGSADVKNQFTWHYDETLSRITTNRFLVTSWRESKL